MLSRLLGQLLFTAENAILPAMRFRLTIWCLLLSMPAWSQVTVVGKVIAWDDRSPLSGVNVVEKGTDNGTATKEDGTFSIQVSDPEATLVFSFIGMITQEHQLKNRREILVVAKWECAKDFFDSQQMKFYGLSGVLNNPFGGGIQVNSPSVRGGVVKASYRYQTDFEDNTMQTARADLDHFISTCDYDIDFRWSYRSVAFQEQHEFNVNTFEADLNLGTTIITGYSRLTYWEGEPGLKSRSGVVLGVGQFIPVPSRPTATVKIGLYKDNIEYHADLEGGYKAFVYFARFYKWENFDELSLGVGVRFGYRLRRQKM